MGFNLVGHFRETRKKRTLRFLVQVFPVIHQCAEKHITPSNVPKHHPPELVEQTLGLKVDSKGNRLVIPGEKPQINLNYRPTPADTDYINLVSEEYQDAVTGN